MTHEYVAILQCVSRQCLYVSLGTKTSLRIECKFRAEQYCTGPPEGWAAVGFVSPASFNGGLWARLLRVLGS